MTVTVNNPFRPVHITLKAVIVMMVMMIAMMMLRIVMPNMVMIG